MPHLQISSDISLAHESFGNSADPAVVMVMGATASMLWWPRDLCEGLALRGYHVIRYDHRDTGQSTSVPLGKACYSVEDLADDLMGLLDGLRLDAAHIVGMSLGGLIGQMVAITHPDRILSLTLLGAEPLGWDGEDLPTIDPGFLAHFAGLAELDWSDRRAVTAFMLEGARLSAGDSAGFDPERETRRIEAEIDRAGGDLSSAFNHGSVQLRDSWNGRAAEIDRPTLVLHGENDPIAPIANGHAIASIISGARLVVLTGIGHELPASLIPRLVAEIADFLQSPDHG